MLEVVGPAAHDLVVPDQHVPGCTGIGRRFRSADFRSEVISAIAVDKPEDARAALSDQIVG
jgi:hypothetical protein